MNITTLIPAYKTKYIVELLTSIRNQTFPSQRILISDDSPKGEFRQELNSEHIKPLLSGLNITVVEGPRNGGYENFKHLIHLWDGSSDLVHMMLDDDVIYPAFYERHLVTHASAQISCSVSRRWMSNDAGLILAGQHVPAIVEQNSNRILSLDADVAFMNTVPMCNNWFGEFSNAVMRADTCDLLLKPEMGGVSYAGLEDIGYFLAASMRAPLGYIQDHLGYFRFGSTNNSTNLLGPHMKAAHLGWVALALGGLRVGKLTREQAQICYSIIANAIVIKYAQQEDMHVFCQILPEMAASVSGAEDQFLEAWSVFCKKNGF